MTKPIKILIVDDSLVMRKFLTEIFSEDEELEVVSEASDPYMAVQKLRTVVPDVITLDIEMPKMDGITFLKKLMSQHPIPVVVISSLTEKGTREALKALEYGAVEVIAKPKMVEGTGLRDVKEDFRRIVKSAFDTNLKHLLASLPGAKDSFHPERKSSIRRLSERIIAIGASTGGTSALKVILKGLSSSCPGVIVVQHMPEIFTKQFADRLNNECKIHVKEAEDEDRVYSGHALIAPGNKHMALRGSASNYYVRIMGGSKVNRHRPSIDVLFKSVARYAKDKAVGVLLTGMGKDGASGLLDMKNNGAHTIAQNKSSSIVFGMPKEAIRIGAANEVLPLNKIGMAMQGQ